MKNSLLNPYNKKRKKYKEWVTFQFDVEIRQLEDFFYWKYMLMILFYSSNKKSTIKLQKIAINDNNYLLYNN